MAEFEDIKNDKEHKCEECGKTFSRAVALAGHMRSHIVKNNDETKAVVHEPEIEVFIHNQDGEPNQVFLRMTGKDTPNKKWILKRGEWTKVPKEIITILRDTQVHTKEYAQDEKNPGQFTLRPVTYMRYPFSERIATA